MTWLGVTRNYNTLHHMKQNETPMSYTLGQAAKATGKSKPTIQRAIKAGRMSAILTDQGHYEIDPAELYRVYPPVTVTGNATDDVKQTETPIFNSALQSNLDTLREFVASLENERDDLRRRLDNSEAARERETTEREKNAEELRRLTLLITHQPASQNASSVKTLAVRPWLLVALAAVIIGAALVLWLVYGRPSF